MTASARSKSSAETSARVGLLRFLSRLFVREIDHDLLALLRQDAVREVLSKTEPSLQVTLDQSWGADAFECAAVEYCRLFITPATCPLIASAWCRHTAGGEHSGTEHGVAELTSRLLESMQLDRGDQLPNLQFDPISMLLEIEAWLTENAGPGTAADYAKYALDPWRSAFASRLISNTEHAVYRVAGRLLAQTAAQ